jgi:hypothetical protein
MWRKSLGAIWRNSRKKLRRPKGNSRVCRDDSMLLKVRFKQPEA